MELTEKKLAEFFPSDNRFIYYCAKHYGYTFHNDDMVNDARYYSSLNVLNYIRKHGSVFDNEQMMVGRVMSCIRYGILSAFSDKEGGRKQRIESRPFSDFITNSNWGSNSKGEYNRVENSMANSFQQDEDHYRPLLEILKEHRLSDLQNKVLQECILDGKTTKQFCAEHEVTDSAVSNAKYVIKNRFKKLIEKEDEQVSNYQERVPQVKRGVRTDNGNKSELEYEEKEYRYLKAMSFLYT